MNRCHQLTGSCDAVDADNAEVLMPIDMLLEMATSHDNRILVGSRSDGLTGAELAGRAAAGAAEIRRSGARHVAFLDLNSPALPVAIFAGSLAGVPVTPLNYRLSPDALLGLISRLDRPLLIGDAGYLDQMAPCPGVVRTVTTSEWMRVAEAADVGDLRPVPDSATAVMLFTSGTTSTLKGVLLSHANLLAYVLQTVEFGAAADDEAALVSVPPYHIAGVGTVLTNIYAGRRLAYLSNFSPEDWLRTVREESVTSAMLVPTMLGRVVDHLGATTPHVPTLRAIAYGGSRLPRPVLEKALEKFPAVDFTNAYGLTETSSTIAILGPDDHRAAASSADPAIRERLGSAGRFVPGVEGQVRDEHGNPVESGLGELWVRGPQVSGTYAGAESVLDDNGWFPTRDRAWIDPEGFLFIEGRSDDTIIRGGENIAPAEIEDVLLGHPDVADVAVFGRPDEHWGERIVAAIVPRTPGQLDGEPFRAWVRERLRSSRTPDDVLFTTELPYTGTGKLLRRELKEREVPVEVRNEPQQRAQAAQSGV